jgi:hypothetical protein
MHLEKVQINGVRINHPLAAVRGAAAKKARVDEMRLELIAAAQERATSDGSGLPSSPVSAPSASSTSSSSAASPRGVAWSLAMDEALTAVLQAVAQRAGVSPADLELLVNFAPTAVDLSRYPALQSLSLAQLRARA